MGDTRIFLRSFASPEGLVYEVTVVAKKRSDGTWSGALEFRNASEQRLAEGETSQPNLDAIHYWSSGLEDVFLEGALLRAK